MRDLVDEYYATNGEPNILGDTHGNKRVTIVDQKDILLKTIADAVAEYEAVTETISCCSVMLNNQEYVFDGEKLVLIKSNNCNSCDTNLCGYKESS